MPCLMEKTKSINRNHSINRLRTVGVTVIGLVLSLAAARSQITTNVFLDPSWAWNGYENVFHQDGSYWRGDYFGPGSTGILQGSINNSGIVLCAPDIRMDRDFHLDTTAWEDGSGTSPGICKVQSTFYVDTTSVAGGGDTVVFSGTFITNTLADSYSNTIVAFIKDFSPSYALNGMVAVNLNTLSNGQQCRIETTIAATGDHVQWGLEWSGPPARTNSVASLGYALVSSNSVAPVGPAVLAIAPQAANVVSGSNITFTATVTGGGLSYQWYKDDKKLVNGPGVSGAASAALTLQNVSCNQEGTYPLLVTDSSNLEAFNPASLVVYNPGWLYFDPALAPFNGYINAYDITNISPPASGSNGTTVRSVTGFNVAPTTLLRASVSNDVITFQPNTYVYDNATNSSDPFWIQSDGSPNKYLEQDFFILADHLQGQTLTFAGYCSSNSLDPSYAAVAWIKDMNPDYSVERRYDVPLVAGKPFNLTVQTIATNHVQYGFALFGPDNSSTNPITRGAVEVKIYSPLVATSTSGKVALEFPTVIN